MSARAGPLEGLRNCRSGENRGRFFHGPFKTRPVPPPLRGTKLSFAGSFHWYETRPALLYLTFATVTHFRYACRDHSRHYVCTNTPFSMARASRTSVGVWESILSLSVQSISSQCSAIDCPKSRLLFLPVVSDSSPPYPCEARTRTPRAFVMYLET